MDPGLQKCDIAAREAVAHASPGERLEILVRVAGSLGALRRELEQSGLNVHTTTGPIATGTITAKDMAALAALPFVRRVELSRQLHSE